MSEFRTEEVTVSDRATEKRIRTCECGARIKPQQGWALHYRTECPLNPTNGAAEEDG